MEETLSWIDGVVARRDPSFLVTANLDFAAQAAEDIELQRILAEADRVVCDGTPLLWASRLAGTPLRERVAGSDLIPRLAARAEERAFRLFLLGGEPTVLEKAAEKLEALHPGLPSVGYYSPPFVPLHEFDHEETVRRIQEARPDILLVAFGCPKQEKWIYMHYRRLGVPCSIGVGATIDFLAGKVSRAPRWMAKAGLEWIYRMAQEPRRLFGRYAKDIFFLFAQILRERKIGSASSVMASDNRAKVPVETCLVRWMGELRREQLNAFAPLDPSDPTVLDLSSIESIDRAGIARVLQEARRFWKKGTGFCLLAPSAAVETTLRTTRLRRILDIAENPEEAVRLLRFSAALHRIRPMVEEEDVLSFRMPERLVAANAESCGNAVESEWVAFPEALALRLDFGQTRFMDSSGLGMVLRCRKMADSRVGGRIQLVRVGENIRNVIRLARLEKVLFENEEPGEGR